MLTSRYHRAWEDSKKECLQLSSAAHGFPHTRSDNTVCNKDNVAFHSRAGRDIIMEAAIELPASACRECTRLIDQNVENTAIAGEGEFIDCDCCHFLACHTIVCCGEVPSGDELATKLYCSPCFRVWCSEKIARLGELAAASLSGGVAASAGTPGSTPPSLPVPLPPSADARYFFSAILKDGLCLFRGFLRFFKKTITPSSSQGGPVRVTPVMLCQFITDTMTKTDSGYWARLEREYPDFSPGNPEACLLCTCERCL